MICTLITIVVCFYMFCFTAGECFVNWLRYKQSIAKLNSEKSKEVQS